ncbi:putative GIY-YIG superfamily endonuclease [Winogradskyella wandonensis]|uniref:Putative GIY-YIG superfamily endonuclease n=1 Tax=Winogradskyella wandonensis TaxID=1442586 RepID=A0A4R1KM05_9FLAO|nr:GIY-YIG nuclease family protein [Winogradskyella wandonensis]TCK64839.1 putative GIY-YIG superfamily endonuclease [Winogradskyella wandonensis]
MDYYVYIIYSESKDTYYKGITNNSKRRLYEHNSKSNSGYTKSGKPWVETLVIKKPNKDKAYLLEKKLKNLNRKRLEDFIEK